MTAQRKTQERTPAANPDRRSLLARLHQLKAKLGLDDETYRDKLEGFAGKRSAADLSDVHLREVLRVWSQALPEGERGHFGSARRGAALKEPYQRLVRALWIALWNMGATEDGSDKALDAFVARQAKVSSLAFLRAQAAPGVIEALKDWLVREGVKLQGDRMKGREGRIALVRAQWEKVAAAKHEGALLSWLNGRIVPGARELAQLSDEQLDAASKALGDWIRSAKPRATP